MSEPTATPVPAARPAAPAWARLVFTAAAALVLGAPILNAGWDWLNAGQLALPASVNAERLDLAAKPFVLPDLSGRPVRLSDFEGRVVLLNFWATWCPPCVEELPSMRALADRMRGRDFTILAVSEDESVDDVHRFFAGDPPSFPVLFDEGQQITKSYGTFKFPETWIIDRTGRIRARFIGSVDWTDPAIVGWLERLAG